MPAARPQKSNFTAGEFDPALDVRSDTTFYSNAAAVLENLVVQPQGGVRQRGGLPAVAQQRGILNAVPLNISQVTSTNATDEANLIDGNPGTVMLTGPGLLGSVGYQVWRVDFGAAAPEPIVAIDCLDNQLTANFAVEFAIQASPDGANWTTVGIVDVTGSASSRRIAAPPGASLGSQRFWQMVRSDGLNVGTTRVQLSGLRFWTEGELGNCRLISMNREASAEYVFMLTDGNMDIIRADTRTWVAAVGCPYSDGDVFNVTRAQSRDQLVTFERNYPQQSIFRQGSDDRWDFRDLVFESVTEFPWGDQFVTGGENEVQTLAMTASAGNQFKFELNSEFSAAIAVSASDAATAASMTAALIAMDQLSSVTVTVTAAQTFDIEFTGADGNKPQQLLIAVSLVGSGAYQMRRTNRGKEPTAPLWDGNHGYPSCGTFYQGRMFQGGFRDRRDAIAGSRAGSFFEFKLDEEASSDSPLLFAADTDEQTEVTAMHAGRHLQIFCTSGEFFVPSEPISVENIALKQTSRIGSAIGLPTFDVEGATLFFGSNGVHEYLFVDAEQSYQANLISLLASHLVADPVALAFRRRQSGNDGDLFMLANTGLDADGNRVPFAIATVLRSQQITAFTRATTPNGTFEGVTATQTGQAFLLAERTINGVRRRFLEAWDDTHMLDGGARLENADVTLATGDGVRTEFAWSFASPSDPADVGVFTRLGNSAVWMRVGFDDYAVNLSIGRIEFATAPASGAQIRIALRMSSVALTAATAHLDGVELVTVADGIPSGPVTPSGGVLAMGDVEAFFSVEYGFEFPVRVVTLPERIETREGVPFAGKMRIPEITASILRTGGFAIGMLGFRGRVPALLTEGARADLTASERLYTGSLRVHGLPGLAMRAQIEAVRQAPEPFNLLGINYLVRW